METLAIDERKVFTDVTLEVALTNDNSCDGCWFYSQEPICYNHPRRKIMGGCTWLLREDGKNVIFKEIKGKEN